MNSDLETIRGYNKMEFLRIILFAALLAPLFLRTVFSTIHCLHCKGNEGGTQTSDCEPMEEFTKVECHTANLEATQVPVCYEEKGEEFNNNTGRMEIYVTKGCVAVNLQEAAQLPKCVTTKPNTTLITECKCKEENCNYFLRFVNLSSGATNTSSTASILWHSKFKHHHWSAGQVLVLILSCSSVTTLVWAQLSS